MVITGFNISKANQLIQDFSVLQLDETNTKHFAAKAAIIHLEKLKLLIDTDLTDFNQQIEHLKTYL